MKRRKFLKIFGVSAVAVPAVVGLVSSVVAEEPKNHYQGILAQIENGNTQEYTIMCGADFKKEFDSVLLEAGMGAMI